MNSDLTPSSQSPQRVKTYPGALDGLYNILIILNLILKSCFLGTLGFLNLLTQEKHDSKLMS